MQIDPELAARALSEGLQKYPRFEKYHPKLVVRALMLEYVEGPPSGDPDAWEFQNAVVRAYKRLAEP